MMMDWYRAMRNAKRKISIFRQASSMFHWVMFTYIAVTLYWVVNIIVSASLLTTITGLFTISFFVLFASMEIQMVRTVAIHSLMFKSKKPSWHIMTILRMVDPELRNEIKVCHLHPMKLPTNDKNLNLLATHIIGNEDEMYDFLTYVRYSYLMSSEDDLLYIPFKSKESPTEFALEKE